MAAFLALLAFLHQADLHVEDVLIPSSDAVQLHAALVQPDGPAKAPSVVALHGCGGIIAERIGAWAQTLSQAGHIVLIPDSYGARGIKSQCRDQQPAVTTSGQRRRDAIAAAEWLIRRPGSPSGGLALVGWSAGGNTVLWTAQDKPSLPAGLFSRFVAFYPGCATAARIPAWQPAAPMLVLVGANDDWTPAPPCRDLAARFPQLITLKVYPDSWHDFDAAGLPVRELTGLATPPSGTGQAHVGGNEAARQDAIQRVLTFLAGAS